MRNIITILLLLISVFAHGAIALVTSVNLQFGGSGGTSSSVTTTGATLIVVCLSYRTAQGSNLSDSKGNTWTKLTNYDGGTGNVSGVVFYYCVNPTVGSGHTFSTTSNFGGLSAFAFSGTRTSSPKDQENGIYQGTLGSSLSSGSITPTANGCVVLTTCMNYNGATPTMPSGYTGYNWTTGTAYAGGAGYKIQTTASAENPSWANMNSGSNGAVNVVSFFEPAATPTANAAFFFNLLK